MASRKQPRRRAAARSASNTPSLAKQAVNLFVFGDLVIDHTAFVNEMAANYPVPVAGEQAFRVRHRLDTAGGAATTARTIDALTSGTTFLWGLIGNSPWGTFRAILENSQALDAAKSRIEFRGARDDTDAPMTTISRLVAIHDVDPTRERYERKARFADFGQLHIPLERQLSAINFHLDRVHRTKAPLDGIVLNDLDMGALRTEVVATIAAFAALHRIPVTLRARRDASKYTEVHAAAMVCTLAEWKLLVGSAHEPDYWIRNIAKPEYAEEFARQTLCVFHQIKRFAILVGDDWIDQIVTIEQPSAVNGKCRLLVQPGMPAEDKGKSQQVGASDVFAGALALGLADGNGDARGFQEAVRFARRVTHAYQHASWHHVPAPHLIASRGLDGVDQDREVASRIFGTPYLPPTASIDLHAAKTSVPKIYSVTSAVRDLLQDMSKEVADGDRSIVLVASGGSGKSEIARFLQSLASSLGLEAQRLEDLGVNWSWAAPARTVEAVLGACQGKSSNRPFVVVDEALKLKGAGTLASKGVVLLNAAQEAGIRFLLIDADFARLDQEALRSQFGRRVAWFNLPAAWDRPSDIPYVLGACLRDRIASRNVACSIEASALVAIIEWMLDKHQSYGHLVTLAKALVAPHSESTSICLRWADLPPGVQGAYEPHRGAPVAEYSFKFDWP